MAKEESENFDEKNNDKEKNQFDDILKNDPEFMKDIWVNYPGTRGEREELAKEFWEKLYNQSPQDNGNTKDKGNIDSADLTKDFSNEISDMFSDLTKDNPDLSKQMVQDFFSQLKEELEKNPDGKLDANQIIDNLKNNQNDWQNHTKNFTEKLKDLQANATENSNLENMKIWEQYEKDALSEFQKNIDQIDQINSLPADQQTDVLELMEYYQNLLNVTEEEINHQLNFARAYRNDPNIYPQLMSDIQAKQKLAQALRQDLSQLNSYFNHWLKTMLNMRKHFKKLRAQLDQVQDVFGKTIIREIGWDLNRGILTQFKWLDLKEISDHLKEKKEIHDLIEALGKLQDGITSEEKELIEQELRKKVKVPKITKRAKSEIFGVHLGQNLSHVLPGELSQLNDKRKILRKVFLSKYLEGRLLSYDLQGIEKQKKNKIRKRQREILKSLEQGPFILCIDTSGSMVGYPERTAKALTLAMVQLALKEKRECYLIAFSGPNEIIEQELTTGKDVLEKLIHFLTYSFEGGTDFEPPLEKALKVLEKKAYKRGDILMVSDGYGEISDRFIEHLNTEKEKKNFKIHTVILSEEDEEFEGNVEFSDYLYKIPIEDGEWEDND